MRSLSALSAAVLAFAAVISPCFANSTAVCGMIAGGPIPQNYLAGTNKCSVGETVGARTLHCVDDGGIAATFGTSVTEYQAAVAGGGWLDLVSASVL